MFLYVLCAISCCDKTEHIGPKNAWSGIGNDCDLALLGSVATDILSWWNYPNVSSKTSSSVVIKTCFPPVQSKKCGVAILKVRTIFHSESPHDLPFWKSARSSILTRKQRVWLVQCIFLDVGNLLLSGSVCISVSPTRIVLQRFCIITTHTVSF